ncbi:GOLPH3/VPS74 family protein [Mobilicoccus pelagius]|uniref:GPP34 family phosphoprotein n=1 Tax=Mobilicoccus pelagius NBRC 104925 TaxID=1089455 RepID=H5UND1_9MICO|nr:GPP34 family phosphoprotein [Mobilicoccus pelagius]GAB47239.1 hypothetical protein MOPEL_007_00550 [Mobilicoccus pelagius NBRC 104925]
MIIAEELLLLLTRDDGRPESAFTQDTYGYAAANLADLVLAERITLDERKDPRVTVVDPTPVGHPALDAALARLTEKSGKKISGLVQDGKVAARDEVVRALADAGVVGVEPKRMLGLVAEKHPVRDTAAERALRERLRAVLHGATATPGEATLLAVLQGLGVVRKVLAEESSGMSRREVKARIETATTTAPEGEVVGEAVVRAIQSMNAAIVTAAIIPATTAGASS